MQIAVVVIAGAPDTVVAWTRGHKEIWIGVEIMAGRSRSGITGVAVSGGNDPQGRVDIRTGISPNDRIGNRRLRVLRQIVYSSGVAGNRAINEIHLRRVG